MDPFITGSLISAGGSLLGGLFGSSGGKTVSSRRQVRQSIEGAAQGARFFSEEYGFNPLTLLGVAGVTPTQVIPGNNYMGSAIADAGMALADGMARKAISDKESLLERENRELREKVQQMTIRPQIGGVYARRAATPTLRQAVGGANADMVARPAVVGQGVDNSAVHSDAGLGTQPNPVAPGREKETDPVKNVSGVFEIQNALTANKPVSLYGQDADEVTDLILQLPIVMPQVSYNWGQRFGDRALIREGVASGKDGRPVSRMSDGKYYARQPDPEIDGGIYLRSPSVPPPARPTRNYKPPVKRTPTPRVWEY